MGRAAFLLAALTLGGCTAPVAVEAIAGRTFLVSNRGDGDLRVQRLIANDGDGRAECVQSPAAMLGPGRSLTVTFFDCGAVTKLEVETDRGNHDFDFEEPAGKAG